MPSATSARSEALGGQSGATRGELRWFPVAWPAIVFFHLAGNPGSLYPFSTAGMFQVFWIVGALGLAVTGRRWWLLLLTLAHVVVLSLKAPVYGNHEVLMVLVEFAGIAALVGTARAGDWLAHWASASRAVLIVAYSAFAFAKLNGDFFDRTVSCAVVLSSELGLPTDSVAWLGVAVIWGSALTEIAIAVMLWIPRTRVVAAVLGMAFHFVLALEPSGHVFDFSSVLFVLFALFIPGVMTQLPTLKLRPSTVALAVVALAVTAIAALVTPLPNWFVAWPLWIVGGGLWAWTLSRHAVTQIRSEPVRVWSGLSAATTVVVLLALINAVSPYAGVKTSAGFNMYANLRVSPHGNHFIVGDVGQGPSNPVRILTGPDDAGAAWTALREEGWSVPASNVAAWLRANPDESLEVKLADGSVVIIDDTTVEAVLGEAPSWLEQTFGVSRTFTSEGPQQCRRVFSPLW